MMKLSVNQNSDDQDQDLESGDQGQEFKDQEQESKDQEQESEEQKQEQEKEQEQVLEQNSDTECMDQFDELINCEITRYSDESLLLPLNQVLPFKELNEFDKLISSLICHNPKNSLCENLGSVLTHKSPKKESRCDESDIFPLGSIFFDPCTYDSIDSTLTNIFEVMPKKMFDDKEVINDIMIHHFDESRKYLDESIKKILKDVMDPIDKFIKTLPDNFQKNTSNMQNKSNNKVTNRSISKKILDLLGTDLTKTIIVMIDFENIGKMETNEINTVAINSMKKNRDIKIIVMNFVSYCNTAVIHADIVVRSNRKDATDHYIGYCIGILESQPYPPQQIHVISKDHFACCLQDFCRNVIHNPSSDDFARMLVNYKSK